MIESLLSHNTEQLAARSQYCVTRTCAKRYLAALLRGSSLNIVASRRAVTELALAAPLVRNFPQQRPEAIECPVYMFHLTGGSAVESVIRINNNQGRKSVTVAYLAEVLLDEREIPDFPMYCLTFDDGYRIQYDQALPVLDRLQATATFYVMGTGWQGDGVHSYMTAQQIKELADNGYEIGSHTVNHEPNLPALRLSNRGAYYGEIEGSKIQLKELLGSEVTTFAYPHGVLNQEVVNDISTLYKAAVTTIDGRIQTLDGIHRLKRTRIN